MKSNPNQWSAVQAGTMTPPGTGSVSFTVGTGFNIAGTPIAMNPMANGLYADLSTATAATINAIRIAFQVQKLLERDARGGTRYTEIIRSHFGVVSPDSRHIVTGKQIGRAHV